MELQENSQICMIEYGFKSDGLSRALYWGLDPQVGSFLRFSGHLSSRKDLLILILGQAVCKVSSNSTSLLWAIILLSYHFTALLTLCLPILYLSCSLAANGLSPHLIEKAGVSRRELSLFLPTISTQLCSAYFLVTMN